MFSKLFGRGRAPSFEGYESLPYPDQPVEIVGDVHGCASLLDELPPCEPGVPRIFVGDIVDRGPDSRGVIERVRAHDEAGKGTCLLGNHEAMMLEFLDEPEKAGRRWLRHGGVETLASFDLRDIDPGMEDPLIFELRDAFRNALGEDTVIWLRNRPLLWRSGSLVVVHAAADPSRAMQDQPAQSLLWGHKDFFRKRRADGLWIAHGHVIIDDPRAEEGRIGVDTGAYLTGRLTMARVDPSGVTSFVTVKAD